MTQSIQNSLQGKWFLSSIVLILLHLTSFLQEKELNHPGKKFVLKVSILANMEADVYLPKISEKYAVTQNNKHVNTVKTDDFIIVENVGSGTNKFEIIQKK